MGIIKRKEEFIDIPELQRRGILMKHNSPSFPQAEYAELPVVPQRAQSETNPLSFFDNLVAANSPQEPQGLPSPSTHEPTDIVDLKVKLEDFEYKLERFAEKLAIIESTLEELGNKGF